MNVAPNTYLKSNKYIALQIQKNYSGNKVMGYKVVKIDLRTKKLRPVLVRKFKTRIAAQQYVKNLR